jgi:hypothetical protein
MPRQSPTLPDMSERTWACEVSGPVDDLPPGSDLPMRMAVRDAFKQLTGHNDTVLRSGWGLSLSRSLDAAWAEAEAALPGDSGLGVSKTVGVTSGAYVATTDSGMPRDGYAYGPTPAAALRALAAKLREVGR